MTLVLCFGPKPNVCSFNLDLDQAEQKRLKNWGGYSLGDFPRRVGLSSIIYIKFLIHKES